jgi:Helix-turn-helix domain
VPIGETLAEARQRAGLTVAQVSVQTCLKKAVIEAIEGGDYSAGGGDLYARANIRSIAWVVGADPRPLIAEYDARHRARDASPTVSLEELLATSKPAPAPRRHRPGLPAVAGAMAAGYASVRRRADSRVAREPAEPAYRPPGRWLYWVVVVGLVAVLGFGVYSHFSGQQHVALASPAAGKHAVTRRQAGGGGPSPAPTATHAAAPPGPAPTITHAAMAPAPAVAAPAQTLTPASAATPDGAATPAGAAAPGPGGSPSPAPRATGGNHPAGGHGTPGSAHRLVHHRPLPKPGARHGPAPGQAPPGHGHGRPDHHRQRAHKSAGSRENRQAPSRQAR